LEFSTAEAKVARFRLGRGSRFIGEPDLRTCAHRFRGQSAAFGKWDIGGELVALSANCYDQTGFLRNFLQSLPQMRNVLRQVSLFDKGVLPTAALTTRPCNQPLRVLSGKKGLRSFRMRGDRRSVAVEVVVSWVQHIWSEQYKWFIEKPIVPFTPTLPSFSSFVSDSLSTSQKLFCRMRPRQREIERHFAGHKRTPQRVVGCQIKESLKKR